MQLPSHTLSSTGVELRVVWMINNMPPFYVDVITYHGHDVNCKMPDEIANQIRVYVLAD